MATTPTVQNLDAIDDTTLNADATANAGNAGDNVDPQANANAGEIKPKPLGGYQKKILKLEQEKETLLEALRRSGGETKPVVAKPAVEVEDPEPKEEDFATTGEYIKAVRAYDAKQTDKLVDKKLAEREQKQTTQSEEQKRHKAFAEKLQAFVDTEAPDYDEVINASGVRANNAMQAAINESDIGPALVYYLAKNEEEAERIYNLSPIKAAVAMGRIEASLAKQETVAEGAEKLPTPPPISKAPPPTNPVRKTGPVTHDVKPDDPASDKSLSDKEWYAKRQAQKHKR